MSRRGQAHARKRGIAEWKRVFSRRGRKKRRPETYMNAVKSPGTGPVSSRNQVMSSMRCRATRAHVGDVVVDGDPVDHPPGHQLLEHPAQVGGVDAEHGRAGADQRVERHDRQVGVLGGQALDQVDLGGRLPSTDPAGARSTAAMM